jgi:hypothetical protein
LALWQAIMRRRAGAKQDRKYFVLTRKARKELELPTPFAPQNWAIVQRVGSPVFEAHAGPIGGEYGARFLRANFVRVVRHRGAMRGQHYILKLADRE